MSEDTSEEMIEMLARAAHEANRSYCIYIGDKSHPPWDDAPNWHKESLRKGVVGALRGNTPEQSHLGWMLAKQLDGWVYGEEKDVLLKTHPCMVPYSKLPGAQKLKDSIFLQTILAVHSVLKEAQR
jgi:hypothetical protein